MMTETIKAYTIADFFAHRKVVIATRHGKEAVIGPMVEKMMGLECIVPYDLNTDQFGTFTGEIPRSSGAAETLRAKILHALEVTGETLGIGNEGSFGPHPHIPFLPADHEYTMLIDLTSGLSVTASYLSLKTNYASEPIADAPSLESFATRIGFPGHGVILRGERPGHAPVLVKNACTWPELNDRLEALLSGGWQVTAETDMRAMKNPTRMIAIEQSTEKLMQQVTSRCPSCHWPGFSVHETKPGLPCQACGQPTSLTLSRTYACQQCGYQDERFYLDGHHADPQYCDECNP